MPHAYDLFFDKELFVVRWREPSESGALTLASALEQRYSKIGAPLFFVIIIGPDCPPPDRAAAEVMLRQHERIYDLTRTVRAVVIGGSIRQSVMRSVMTAMTLAAGLRGQPFAVDKCVSDLAKIVAQTLGHDVGALLRAMIDSGVVNAQEAGLAVANA